MNRISYGKKIYGVILDNYMYIFPRQKIFIYLLEVSIPAKYIWGLR